MRTPKVRTSQPRCATIVRPDFLFEKIRHVYFVGEPRSLGIYSPPSVLPPPLCGVPIHAARTIFVVKGRWESGKSKTECQFKIKLDGEYPARLLDIQNVITPYIHLS